MTFVLMRALTDRGLVECKGAIATLAPSRARARLVRGTLNELGLNEVPVAIGSDGGFTGHTATFEDTASSYIAPDNGSFATLSGVDLLMEVYASAAPQSLELLCIASMKDAAQFVCHHEYLFKEKTRCVTIMGGVMPFEDEEDETTLLVPDTVSQLHHFTTKCCFFLQCSLRFPQAHNNQFCVESSDYFYRRVQELKIPMIIMCRHAAYVCPMPRSIYGMSRPFNESCVFRRDIAFLFSFPRHALTDDMARTGHPIWNRLRDTQRGSIEGLWKRACAEGAERLGLPTRCDKQWFRSTFLNGNGGDRTGKDSIWDLVVSFMM